MPHKKIIKGFLVPFYPTVGWNGTQKNLMIFTAYFLKGLYSHNQVLTTISLFYFLIRNIYKINSIFYMEYRRFWFVKDSVEFKVIELKLVPIAIFWPYPSKKVGDNKNNKKSLKIRHPVWTLLWWLAYSGQLNLVLLLPVL